jgi:hypothetical protein
MPEIESGSESLWFESFTMMGAAILCLQLTAFGYENQSYHRGHHWLFEKKARKLGVGLGMRGLIPLCHVPPFALRELSKNLNALTKQLFG